MSPESEKIEVSGLYYHIGQIYKLCQCGFQLRVVFFAKHEGNWSASSSCKYEFTNIKLVLRAVLPV